MRNSDHYVAIMERNPRCSIGVRVVAKAVYAANHPDNHIGMLEALDLIHRSSPTGYKDPLLEAYDEEMKISERKLRETYGDSIESEEVLELMFPG